MGEQDEIRVTLRDGTPVVIRPIRPADRRALEEAFAQLSPRSRYLRFHTFIDSLSDAQLRYLTEVDHDRHVALVAAHADHPEGPGLGVARYVRLEDSDVAEAAVTVVDAYQGQGLGTLLLGALAQHALAHGVTTFRNYVLAENTGMLALFEDLGATKTSDGGGVYRVDLALPKAAEDLPDTPTGRVLRAAATRLLPPLDPSLPPVWHRREERTDEADRPEDAGGEGSATGKGRWRERGALRDWLDEALGSISPWSPDRGFPPEADGEDPPPR